MYVYTYNFKSGMVGKSATLGPLAACDSSAVCTLINWAIACSCWELAAILCISVLVFVHIWSATALWFYEATYLKGHANAQPLKREKYTTKSINTFQY
jgi:hypothetical protein